MNNIRKVLREIDIFSVPFTPSMDANNQFYYKSVTGGCVSIIVILLSLVYTLYQIVQWQSDQFLPKVTSQFQKISSEQTLMKNYITVQVQSTGYNDDGSPTVDPFDPNAIIYYPIISLDVADYYNYVDYTPYYADGNLNISLVFYNESQPVITFIKCQEEFLKAGQKCGSEEQRAKFEAQSGNQFYIKVLFQLLNPDNFDVQTVGRTYSILIEDNVCTIDTLYLQLTKYDVDRGALLKQSEQYFLFTDGEMDSGRASQTYCGKLWLPQTAGVIWLIQEKQVKNEKMVYPKIGEVFAQIGSIVSLLFLTRYAIYQLNGIRMKNKMLDFLISSYYPEIQLFKVKVNWMKRTQSVTYKNSKVNVKSYDEFIVKKRKEIECKLNFMNLVYEISKIQTVLQDQLGRQCLEKCLKLGIKLNMQKQEDEILLSNSKMKNSEDIVPFEDQDILLFSIRNMQKQNDDVDVCAIS